MSIAWLIIRLINIRLVIDLLMCVYSDHNAPLYIHIEISIIIQIAISHYQALRRTIIDAHNSQPDPRPACDDSCHDDAAESLVAPDGGTFSANQRFQSSNRRGNVCQPAATSTR